MGAIQRGGPLSCVQKDRTAMFRCDAVVPVVSAIALVLVASMSVSASAQAVSVAVGNAGQLHIRL
jgi:hypothetical protein